MSANSSKRGLNVFIDSNRCVGNAACTWAAPGIYVLDEETRKAVLENVDDATVDQLFAGARACPTRAIIISQFGRRVFPTILPPMFGESADKPDDGGPDDGDGS